MTSRLLALFTAAVLAASSAFGEAYKINVHLEPGVGTGLSPGFFVSGAALKVELGLLSVGPVAPQAQIFGLGTHDPTALAQGSLFGAALGLRWRILNDEKGYLFMPGGKPGNLFGNLWLDADLAVTNGGPRVGFDVALGAELSLIDGLQVGPFAKLYFIKDTALIFGLSFSVGGPQAPAPEAVDTDKDGIPDAIDKCPNEPEDKNGIDDTDGCPEGDVKKSPEPKPVEVKPEEAPAPETAPQPDVTPSPDSVPKQE